VQRLAARVPVDEHVKQAFNLFERFGPEIPTDERGWGAEDVLDLAQFEALAKRRQAGAGRAPCRPVKRSLRADEPENRPVRRARWDVGPRSRRDVAPCRLAFPRPEELTRRHGLHVIVDRKDSPSFTAAIEFEQCSP